MPLSERTDEREHVLEPFARTIFVHHNDPDDYKNIVAKLGYEQAAQKILERAQLPGMCHCERSEAISSYRKGEIASPFGLATTDTATALVWLHLQLFSTDEWLQYMKRTGYAPPLWAAQEQARELGAPKVSNPGEAPTRRELIDPALKKAAWDIDNPQEPGLEIRVHGFQPAARRALRSTSAPSG